MTVIKIDCYKELTVCQLLHSSSATAFVNMKSKITLANLDIPCDRVERKTVYKKSHNEVDAGLEKVVNQFTNDLTQSQKTSSHAWLCSRVMAQEC